MSKIKNLYFRSGWYSVYNLSSVGGKARSSLLAAVIAQAVVAGFSGGIFYTGLLMGYGINIVNISIITIVPYIASLFSLFTPYILERFKKRKAILSTARICYYVINILGITLLPQLVHSDRGRIAGLVGIVFLSHVINFLFTSGYSAWHMPYIVPEVRNDYFTSTTLVSNVSSSIVLILASLVTDRLHGEAQLHLIVALRYVAFAIALLDVYFLQKPKEPEYQVTSSRPSFLPGHFQIAYVQQEVPADHVDLRDVCLLCQCGYFCDQYMAAGGCANQLSVHQCDQRDLCHRDYCHIEILESLYPEVWHV